MARPANGGKRWAAHAPELAAWAWRRLVNRVDCWGAYGRDGGTWTAPPRARRGRVLLTLDRLESHFAGRSRADRIGLHSTAPGNTSRWGALDIDCHDGGQADPEANWAAARGWYRRLAELGFAPLLTDSNGKGGYHLLALFRDPEPTPQVFAFLRGLVADYRCHGLTSPPETFPNQPTILPERFGNWLRLPGRHHSRPHWSRAWDGWRWLDDEAAVEHILSLTGSTPPTIPSDIPMTPPRPRPAAPAPRTRPVRLNGNAPTRRITAYIYRLPRLGAGQGRHRVGYALACWLARDLNLGGPVALRWLGRWDAGNAPPLGEDELADLLACAHRYGRRGYGSGLGGAGTRRGHKIQTIRFTVEV